MTQGEFLLVQDIQSFTGMNNHISGHDTVSLSRT